VRWPPAWEIAVRELQGSLRIEDLAGAVEEFPTVRSRYQGTTGQDTAD
jgi:hypothetical protein